MKRKKRLPRFYANKTVLKILLKRVTGHDFDFIETNDGGIRTVTCFPSNTVTCKGFLDWKYEKNCRRLFGTFTDAALSSMSAWMQYEAEVLNHE